MARFGGGGVEGRRWCIRAAKPLPSPAAVDEARRPHERLRSADDVAMAEECCGREVIVGRRRDEIRGGGGREVEAAEAVVHPGAGWVCRQRPRRRSRSRGSNG